MVHGCLITDKGVGVKKRTDLDTSVPRGKFPQKKQRYVFMFTQTSLNMYMSVFAFYNT